MTIWFTSDTHFGHKNVIKFCSRPYDSVEEMDEKLIAAWNARVKHNDTIYHLGDLSFHKAAETATIISRLNGRIHLVRGNHDREQMLAACSSRLVWIKDYFELKHDKQLIVLSHFPFLTWNKSHHGALHLHGHCHGSLPDSPDALRIDVGVDCHGYAPISLEEIRQKMSMKKFKAVDHHGND